MGPQPFQENSFASEVQDFRAQPHRDSDTSGQLPTGGSSCAEAGGESENGPADLVYLAGIRAKLAERVDTSAGPSACHPWTGGATPDGYGRLYIGDLDLQAHRCALEAKLWRRLRHGEVTRHGGTCTTRLCCNGLHLRPGSIADNNRDTVKHGRAARKLAAEQLREIRLACAGGGWGIYSEVARRFGVTPQYVGRLARGAA